MKKFVIQKHTKGPETHWDLMLQVADVLQTYRLDLPPEKITDQPVTAIRIIDHPLKFLEYQGPVNKGKGSVQIADTGTYHVLKTEPQSQSLEINGKVLKGHYCLTRLENDRWKFKKI